MPSNGSCYIRAIQNHSILLEFHIYIVTAFFIAIECFQDEIDSVCRMILYIFDSNSIPNFTTTSTQQEDAVAPNVIHVAFNTFIDIFLQYC